MSQQCTLECGSLRTMRDECAEDHCLALDPNCPARKDCLEWCCPSNDAAVYGIIIGVILAVIGCIAACIYCCCKKKEQPVVVVQQQGAPVQAQVVQGQPLQDQQYQQQDGTIQQDSPRQVAPVDEKQA